MEQSEGPFQKYASVLLDVAVGKPLDYGIADKDLPLVKRGCQVQVPVRGTLRTGYVVEVKEKAAFPKVRAIHSLLSPLSDDLFDLATWISHYYNAPMWQVLRSILPASIRQDTAHKEQYCVLRAKSKEILRRACIELREKHPSQGRVLEEILTAKKEILLTELLERAEVSRSPVETLTKKGFLRVERLQIDRSPLIGEEYFKTHAKKLNDEQQTALDKITNKLGEAFETHLLFGVTGSGKTEVYLQAIDKALVKGLGTIMLVPEISLTAQTIERFRSRFEGKIAVLHHRLSHGERFDEWHRIAKGEAKIVVGARSALFSPVPNLGLIIVDEEHDQAYKQSEERPCYHARDLAVVRGKMNKATVVLGSATPSLESYYNCQAGKYHLSKLHSRATKSQLADVTIIDMKPEFEKANGYTSFSEKLIDGMKKRLERGEQVILFLNRRGYHTSLTCKSCGHIFQCPHCEVAMTFHNEENKLDCHLCDHSQSPPPRACPSCGSEETLKFRGVGTEQIERAIHALLPEARTLRVDGDTTRHKGSHERLFRSFATGKADILIGTQMVTKGLHFPSVTLVAVLNSDGSLHIPDFRASERVFQLITQVAGRAGRGHLPGEVIIQTHMPENPTILMAAKQDYEGFYEAEIASRKMFDFPPFTRLVKLTFSGEHAAHTEETAQSIRTALSSKLDGSYQIHPVVPSGYAKIKDQYRFQCLIRGQNVLLVHQALSTLKIPKDIRLHIDTDPTSTFF